MSTLSTLNLSSLPPATLRAALEASENRVRREKEKIEGEIRRLKKRLDELDRGGFPAAPEPSLPEPGHELKNVSSGSQRGKKRLRSDSPSDGEMSDEWYDRQWPIAKSRKLVDSGTDR